MDPGYGAGYNSCGGEAGSGSESNASNNSNTRNKQVKLRASDIKMAGNLDFGADYYSQGWRANQNGQYGIGALRNFQGIAESLSDVGLAMLGAQGVEAIAAWLASLAPVAGSKAKSFFDGTNYSTKVLEQMKGGPGEFHSFPEAVKAFEGSGTVQSVTGGDGVVRQMLEIPGAYQSAGGNWYEGVFQFMKEATGVINHRLFVPSP